MNLYEAFEKEKDITTTLNGNVAYNTSGNVLLDLFSTIGDMRARQEDEIIEKFEKAFRESPKLALKMAFYCGDIRGGLGERRTFRTILRWLSLNHPKVAIKNLDSIHHYNRWDSLFVCIGTPVEDEMWSFIRQQLIKDLRNPEQPSLLAKWMPTINASSEKTRNRAKYARMKLGLNDEKTYRQMISSLRRRINIVETRMSANNWESINYGKLPSLAMKVHRNAFMRHSPEKWSDYIMGLKRGTEKINAETLFPYDIVEQAMSNPKNADFFQAQWNALPDYIEESSKNILVMADISGSMLGRPMWTSIGLATYFAERNKGMFGGCYMTFTNKSEIIFLDPNLSLVDKLTKIMKTDIGLSTNLRAAFIKILNFAIKYNVNDMPAALLVISDMEIDCAQESEKPLDFVQEMEALFKQHGYKLPKLIFWNVGSKKDTFLSQNNNVILVSGQSPSVFKSILNGLDKTAYQLMLGTLLDERYARVRC